MRKQLLRGCRSKRVGHCGLLACRGDSGECRCCRRLGLCVCARMRVMSVQTCLPFCMLRAAAEHVSAWAKVEIMSSQEGAGPPAHPVQHAPAARALAPQPLPVAAQPPALPPPSLVQAPNPPQQLCVGASDSLCEWRCCRHLIAKVLALRVWAERAAHPTPMSNSGHFIS